MLRQDCQFEKALSELNSVEQQLKDSSDAEAREDYEAYANWFQEEKRLLVEKVSSPQTL